MCSQKEYNTPEKHEGNADLLPTGAQCGANWSEIRALIAACEDLPEDVRGQLMALGDRCRVGLNQVLPNDVG